MFFAWVDKLHDKKIQDCENGTAWILENLAFAGGYKYDIVRQNVNVTRKSYLAKKNCGKYVSVLLFKQSEGCKRTYGAQDL